MTANALSTGMAPAAPLIRPNPQQKSAAASASTPAQQPAPSHGQTVAALRHFHAILGELETLLHNPKLGKSDVKSAIIDGTTKLVASRILSPAEAVAQLGSVPTDPQQQRKWLQQHFTNAVMAQNAVLDHHRVAPAGGQQPDETSNPDNHLDDIAALHSQYKNQPQAPQSPQGGMPGFAEGGRPMPGQPAMVGEQGPEVFVPDQPGTIVPNNVLSGPTPDDRAAGIATLRAQMRHPFHAKNFIMMDNYLAGRISDKVPHDVLGPDMSTALANALTATIQK